jgi:SAM-dependent methyltransferase
VDLALMVNVLSALENAKSFLGHLAKGLKPDGRLVVIDWDPTKLYPEMAKQDAKSALGHTLQQLLDADFEVVKTLDFLPAQTIWICKRQVRD